MGAQAQGLGVSPQGHYVITPLEQADGYVCPAIADGPCSEEDQAAGHPSSSSGCAVVCRVSRFVSSFQVDPAGESRLGAAAWRGVSAVRGGGGDRGGVRGGEGEAGGRQGAGREGAEHAVEEGSHSPGSLVPLSGSRAEAHGLVWLAGCRRACSRR